MEHTYRLQIVRICCTRRVVRRNGSEGDYYYRAYRRKPGIPKSGLETLPAGDIAETVIKP